MFILTGCNTIEIDADLWPYSMSYKDYLSLPVNLRKKLYKEECILPVGLDNADFKIKPFEGDTLVPFALPGLLSHSNKTIGLSAHLPFLKPVKIGSKKGSLAPEDIIVSHFSGAEETIFVPKDGKIPISTAGWAREYFPHSYTFNLNFIKTKTGKKAVWWNQKGFSDGWVGASMKGCLRSKAEGWTYSKDIVNSSGVDSSMILSLPVLSSLFAGSVTVLVNAKTGEYRISAVGPLRHINWALSAVVQQPTFTAEMTELSSSLHWKSKKKTLTNTMELLQQATNWEPSEEEEEQNNSFVDPDFDEYLNEEELI